jgi:hypothetical protein
MNIRTKEVLLYENILVLNTLLFASLRGVQVASLFDKSILKK